MTVSSMEYEGGEWKEIFPILVLLFLIFCLVGGIVSIAETSGQITGGGRLAANSADTLVTEKSFSLDIIKKLNKFKPQQVIEFKLPSSYTKEDSALVEILPDERFYFSFEFKAMPVDEFVNLVERFNCKLITYSYRKKVGLFRIGRKKKPSISGGGYLDRSLWTLAIPKEDRNLDSERRKYLINNPDPAHIGILTEECSLINFLGGGYEHTTLEQVNRFTECCTPEHYRKLIAAGDNGFVFKKKKKRGGDLYLKEEIEAAERALDEAIKNLLKKTERLKE